MKCPMCHVSLSGTDYEGVLVETCPKCHGTWLDDSELGHITAARERKYDPEERRALALATPISGVVVSDVDRKLICPRCNAPVRPVNYGGDTGIIIDRCTQCRGIWLDGGELQKVEMLIEGWEDELPSDLQRHGEALRAVEARGEPDTFADQVARFVDGLIGGAFRLQ